MKRIANVIVLMFAAITAHGQSAEPARPPELDKWNVWAGDWILSGKAKDTLADLSTNCFGVCTNTGFWVGFHAG